MPDSIQKSKHLGLTTPLGPDKLLLRSISGTESLSKPFHYDLALLSEDAELDFNAIMGVAVTVRLDMPEERKRYIHGHVSAFSQGVPLGDYYEYKAVVVPFLWFLSQKQNCKIWMEKSVPEIVKGILNDAGYTDIEERITAGDYPPWPYCVQYMETDLNFISRLLEQEGIYYFFKHEDGKHTLVLCDSNSRHTDQEGYDTLPFHRADVQGLFGETEGTDREKVTDWKIERSLRPGKFVHKDYNFTTPTTSLLSQTAISQSHAKGDLEVFEYPGEHPTAAEGDRLALRRMEALAAQHATVKAATNARGVVCGMTFTLSDYWREDQNIKYLVTSVTMNGGVEDYDFLDKAKTPAYGCTFEAIPATVPYRAPRVTPKPRIHGLQTAVVVGTSGEEIDVDDKGRIKVQFHWDRVGTNDENSSCWIRVGQVMSGNLWGGQWIPRMGMEVLVAFLGGDPDQPVITGTLYNESNKHPYALPANKTQSGMKTRSTKEATDQNFNELRFEDKKGEEEVYFHAEKNMTTVVENDSNWNIGFGKKDPGDQKVEIYNHQDVKIGQGSGSGNQTLTVKNDQTVKVESGNHSMEVSSGNHSTKVTSGDMDVKVDAGKIVIEAGTSIELKVGGASIKIEASKITINGSGGKIEIDATAVNSDGSGSKCELGPGAATLSSSGSTSVKGSVAELNGSGSAKVAGASIMIG